MRITSSLAPLALVLAVATVVSACRTGKENTYNFDPAAHQRAVELKARALGLMMVSHEPFGRHSGDADNLNAEMEKAHELSVAAPDNHVIAAEWAAMKEPGGDLYGGFVRRWQASGAVDEATRATAVDRVTVRFDYILCLEAAKRTKAGRCEPPVTGEPQTAQPDASAATPPA
jgi:hypothetical protein